MKKQPDWTWPNGKRIVAIPLSYDVNDMPSMKYGHPPRMMLDSFDEVIDIARAGTMSCASSTSPVTPTYSATIAARISMRRSSNRRGGARHLGRNTRPDRRSCAKHGNHLGVREK